MIRPVVKVSRGRAGHSGPDATSRVVVTVRDTTGTDLRAVISIAEGNDGLTRITVTPAIGTCVVTVNDE